MPDENRRRMISFGGGALLYMLFFLHICAAFLTVIGALNDREEILQLSVDTFHIINSEESRPKINIDDNEEKELLSALLTSYDDLHVKKTINRPLPTVDSSSSIRFLPSSIAFSHQSIAIPRLQTFRIINEKSEPVQILSITGATNEFYSSKIQSTLISPQGGNLSMNIYYLPRTLGHVETTFIFKTNQGDFSYHVRGFGMENPYRLRPLLNIEIPTNVTYEHTIRFSNPYNRSLHINEIYTSDEDLIIELLPVKTPPKNRLTQAFQYHEQWYFNAHETKSIVKLHYTASKAQLFNGFICIKTNLAEKMIIPIEIRVSNRSDLYSNIDLLEFSPERFLRTDKKAIQIPIYALNYGSDPVIITDTRVPLDYETFLQVQYTNLPIPPNINRLNQIADLTIDLPSIPPSLDRVQGSIVISTSRNSQLKIPFDEKIHHGSLSWSSDETEIFLSNQTENKHCQSIRVYNRFQTVLAVQNLTMEKFDFLSKFVQIQYPSSKFYLQPNQWNNFLCLTFSQHSKSLPTIQANIQISTNLSDFSIPIHLYNGLLELDILTDHTNGGIQRNELNPLEFLISSIPRDTTRSVRFVLVNSNPIDIEVEKIQSNLDIQLEYMNSFNANQTKIRFEEKNISSLVIPRQHQVIFLLTIDGTNSSQSYDELLTIQTNSQLLPIHFKYEIIDSSVEFVYDTPLSLAVYPVEIIFSNLDWKSQILSENRLASTEISLDNRFSFPIQLTRIHFLTYGVCFSFASESSSIEKIVLQPNQIQKVLRILLNKEKSSAFRIFPQIGRLNFDLTSLCQLPEWSFYCQSNQQDHPEWRNLLRKKMFHQIQTNIWIYSNEVNISWPVAVHFLWPSVIEQDSSIVDFQLTLVNSTKAEQFVLKNPISDVIEYSIEFETEENNSSFSLSTASKQIEQIYRFTLHPNEQMNFTVTYHPQLLQKDQTSLTIRNNFTTIESISLTGEGGTGNLQIGSSLLPIVIEIDADQHQLCSNPNGNPVLEKILTLRNTGNMPTMVHDVIFGSWRCTENGFSVATCRDIRIEANDQYNLRILYQPDYTSDEINETMMLNTNLGQFVVPITVRIPQQVLASCYKSIARPLWEIRPYCICLCGLCVFIILIFLLAVFDARKSYDNYLIRLEWRDSIQVSDSKIFDLKDLSLAIHDEQKPREQMEILQIPDLKKEQPKPKRSFNSNTNRTGTSNPKVRRATVDTGPSKPVKQPTEPINKSEEKKPLLSTRGRSLTTVSKEEHELILGQKTKRISNKRKGSAGNCKPAEENEFSNDHQWQTVSSSRGQKKANLLSRRETSEDSQTIEKPKTDGSPIPNPLEQIFQQLTEDALPPLALDTKSIPSRSSSEHDEELIDWDEPDIPDEDFGRYALQTEHSMDESNEQKPIPSLMSIDTNPTEPLMSIIVKENIEPLPFPQHKPGPIQRPMHLPCASTATTFDTPQTPGTPDVLVQINHLVDHQNSLSSSSTLINDLPTPNVPWTPFTPTEWSSTWSTATNQNPFVQRQLSKDDSALWSSGNGKDSWLKFSPAPESNWTPFAPSGWPKAPSDENNNDKSRWDFAR